jgi:hypothetical protein
MGNPPQKPDSSAVAIIDTLAHQIALIARQWGLGEMKTRQDLYDAMLDANIADIVAGRAEDLPLLQVEGGPPDVTPLEPGAIRG